MILRVLEASPVGASFFFLDSYQGGGSLAKQFRWRHAVCGHHLAEAAVKGEKKKVQRSMVRYRIRKHISVRLLLRARSPNARASSAGDLLGPPSPLRFLPSLFSTAAVSTSGCRLSSPWGAASDCLDDMERLRLLRPAARLLSGPPPSSLTSLVISRSHKTTSRTKRALKVAPHNSFLPDRSAAFPAPNSIIYNPPASEASLAHTPFIFLPRSDPRRLAILRVRASGTPSADTTPSDESLPPAMNYPRRNPRYHLKEEDVTEIRRLRNEDPVQWSVGRLARKFDCSPIFIQMAAPAPSGHQEWIDAKLERKKARWGPKKLQAREDRKRRAEMLYRGDL